jgi:hypothetical protein
MLFGGLKTPEMQESPQAAANKQSTAMQGSPRKAIDGPGAGCFRGMTGTAGGIIVARGAAVKPA